VPASSNTASASRQTNYCFEHQPPLELVSRPRRTHPRSSSATLTKLYPRMCRTGPRRYGTERRVTRACMVQVAQFYLFDRPTSNLMLLRANLAFMDVYSILLGRRSPWGGRTSPRPRSFTAARTRSFAVHAPNCGSWPLSPSGTTSSLFFVSRLMSVALAGSPSRTLLL
jgi:hypothetical protein